MRHSPSAWLAGCWKKAPSRCGFVCSAAQRRTAADTGHAAVVRWTSVRDTSLDATLLESTDAGSARLLTSHGHDGQRHPHIHT